MNKFRSIAAGFYLITGQILAGQGAECSGPLVGTWKLQSFEVEDIQTHEKRDQFGKNPSGYATYTADCRSDVLMTKENRTKAKSLVPTDEERSVLYQGMIMYGGTYSVQADRVKTLVDISWNQAWTGTTHERKFRIEGNTLYTETLPAKNSLDGKETVYHNVWQRM